MACAVVSRELFVHVVERVIGDAQSEQNLLAGLFSLALLLGMVRSNSAVQSGKDTGANAQRHGHKYLTRKRKPQWALFAPAPILHQPVFQAGRRRPPLERPLQLLFKIVHGFKLHARTPFRERTLSNGLRPWPGAASNRAAGGF